MALKPFDHRVLRIASIVALGMGIIWFLLEYFLTGGYSQVGVYVPGVVAFAILGGFLGLAIRARTSMAGELAVNTELTQVVVLAVSLLPALFLLVYAVVFAVSAAIVPASWVLWLVFLLFAWIVQLLIWGGLVASLVGGVGGIAVYFVVMSILGKIIGDAFMSPWNCSFPNWVKDLGSNLPSWPFIASAIRAAEPDLDHGFIVSLLLTIVLGLTAALVAALVVRWIRQRLMRQISLRPYLPMAAAPVPDEVPMFAQPMLLPIVVYVFLAWSIVIFRVVF